MYSLVTVKHTEGNYKTKGGFFDNNIYGFWSWLKRVIYGIYYNLSRKHLQSYCSEYLYRYNTRTVKDLMRFESTVELYACRRLRYIDLTAKRA
ncbi:hypothetical protein GCM10027037_03400 [Mucilaginibacter koreensis]